MRLRVELSQRADRYEKKYIATLLHGNIVLDENTELPGCKEKYIGFIAGYSPIYTEESKGKVNTRLQYPVYRDVRENNYLYCKLNWFQRQKLSIITRQSWFHQHPVATWALIINTIFLIANLVFAYLNFKISSQNIESNYLKTINKQIEYQNNQMNLYEKQIEKMNEQIYKFQNDSLSR